MLIFRGVLLEIALNSMVSLSLPLWIQDSRILVDTAAQSWRWWRNDDSILASPWWSECILPQWVLSKELTYLMSHGIPPQEKEHHFQKWVLKGGYIYIYLSSQQGVPSFKGPLAPLTRLRLPEKALFPGAQYRFVFNVSDINNPSRCWRYRLVGPWLFGGNDLNQFELQLHSNTHDTGLEQYES